MDISFDFYYSFRKHSFHVPIYKSYLIVLYNRNNCFIAYLKLKKHKQNQNKFREPIRYSLNQIQDLF